MSYRLPRFSYRHAVREVGDGGFSALSSAFVYSAPRTRLLDNQSRQLAGPAANGDFNISYDRVGTTLLQTMPSRLNRLLIPDTHNFGGASGVGGREIRARFDVDGTDGSAFPTWITPELSDGSLHTRLVPSSGLIDWEFADDNDITAAFLELMIFAATTTIPRLGELWWTRTESMVESDVPEWTDVLIPTQERFSLRSGASYVNQTGNDLRAFSLSAICDSGSADDRMLNDLIRRTTALPFWYEHPDSGGKVTTLDSLETLDNVSTVSELDISVVSNGAPDGIADCIEAECNGTVAVYQDVVIALDGVDARDCILQLDIKIVADSSWLDAVHKFAWVPRGGNDLATANYCQYKPAEALYIEKPVDEWVRIQVDVENDIFQNSPRALFDPSNFHRISIRSYFDTIGQKIQYSGLRLIDKRKQPVLVEILGQQRRQVSSVPTSGTRYQYDLDMIEVST